MGRMGVWLSIMGVGLWSLVASAQPAPRSPTAEANLPLTRIVLYASGVGYFQRDGRVDGQRHVTLRFKADTINDLLKSLIAQDFDGGQVTTVTYDSRDPLTRTLKSFALDLTDNAGLGNLLWQMRGERIEVATPSLVQGLILGVETKKERAGDEGVEVEYLNLLADTGMRSIPLTQVQQLQLLNPQLDAEMRQALAVLASSHDTQKKTVTLGLSGEGSRRVRIGYIMETPVWKTSYRLVLADAEAPFVQGWALVENTTDEDWHDVRLSLMSGRPVSFTMDMYEPLYAQRPVVVPEVYAGLRPQVYGQAMESAGEAPKEARLEEGRSARRLAGAGAGAKAESPPPPPAVGGLRGMLAEAKPALPSSPSPIALDQGVSAAAEATELGELFEYAITAPVSLARQKSAMLPIVNATVEGTKVSIYNQGVHAKHPLHGVRVRNVTPLHLSQGPVTVFDGGVYAGDARLDDLAPGQERLLSYAMDLKTEVDPSNEPPQSELVSVSLRKGTLLATQKAVAEKQYTIRNRDQKPRLVLIEHPVRADWQLVAPSTATERTREVYRFAVTVDPGPSTRLRVREEKALQQSVVLSDAGPETLSVYLRAPQVSDKVKQALQRLGALRDKVDQTGQQRRRLEQTIHEITQEQTRMRENMSRLAQNAELYNRYVRKLDQQETDLEKLRKDIEALKTTEEQQRKELSEYLMSLDI